MPTHMLDTDICIHVMKSYPPGLLRRFDSMDRNLCVSAITLSELRLGVEKSLRRETNLLALRTFIARLDVLPFDLVAAEDYGLLRHQLQAVGTPCGLHDTQIGAHARSLGLTVVTNNRREFDRMPGLRVENWLPSDSP